MAGTPPDILNLQLNPTNRTINYMSVEKEEYSRAVEAQEKEAEEKPL